MEKSIFSRDYSLILEQLRETRVAKSLTQAQVAERLQQTQSFVNKIERGERRLDIVELRASSLVIKVCFMAFVEVTDLRKLVHQLKFEDGFSCLDLLV